MKTRRSFFKLMLAIPAVIVYGIAKPHVQNAVLNAVKDKTSGKKNSKNSFTLWQLPSQGPTQMLSYVIKSANGKVIVIDGGMTCDGAYLKKFIKNLGNHVDAWFLTHPHSDHIDALTWVLLNKRDLKIDDIYASFPPLVWIKKHEKSAAHTLEKFNAAMKKSGRKYTKINRGDTFYIDGVNLEILSDVNLDITENAINNSSILIKVSDKNKSVLFTGDLGVRAGNKLLKIIDHNKLKADYVQMAHHGQAGAGKNFYEVVQPEYCLWPTPLWLWNNDRGEGENTAEWRTFEVRQWMKDLKVKKNYVSAFGIVEIK